MMMLMQLISIKHCCQCGVETQPGQGEEEAAVPSASQLSWNWRREGGHGLDTAVLKHLPTPPSPAIFTIGFTYVYKFTVLMKSIGKHQYLNYQQSTSYVSTLTLCIIAVQTASLTPSRPRHPPTAGPRANILISRMPSGICGVQVQVGTTRTVIQVFYLLTSSNDLGCDLLLTLVCWSQRARIRMWRTSKFCTESTNFKAKLNRYSIQMSEHELGVN